MNRIITIACGLVFLGGPSAWGVTTEWIRQLGTSSGDLSTGVSADALGNVYISGLTTGALGGTSAGLSDAFISKYDAAGNRQWTRQLGTSANDEFKDVSADGFGNVYASGYTIGSLGGTNAGGYDAFVSKYDTAGYLQWSRQLGTSSGDVSYGVSADGLGNVYISGTTLGSLGGTSAGDRDVFVAKYDAAGNLQWTRQLGTSAAEQRGGVSADGLGNVYISGSTPGNLGGTNAGNYDAFVSKYDAAGYLQWTRQLGSSNDEESYDVSADGLGNVYVSGYTWGNLGGTNAGSRDAFVSKYDAAGYLQWTRQLGTGLWDESDGVSADGLGNVYISGRTLGNLGGTNAGDGDVFVAKYDAAGSLQWTRQLGTGSDEVNGGVSADGLGNIYISGGTSGSLGGTNAGPYDAYLAKFTETTPGDFNNDGRVDAADYIVWRKGLANGTYTQADYNIWRANFGATAAGAAAVAQSSIKIVPEPSSAIVLSSGLLLLCTVRGFHRPRHRQQRVIPHILLVRAIRLCGSLRQFAVE